MSTRNGPTAEESVKIKRTGHVPLSHRIAPYLTPWAILLAVFIVSVFTHLLCSGPVALAFMAMAAPGLTGVTWSTWDRRHQHARTAATAFAAGTSAWLVLATAIGPFSQVMAFAWFFGGSFLALSWNIRYAGITPSNKHDQVRGEHVNPLGAIKALKSAVPTKVKERPDRVEIVLQHAGGKSTTSDVQAKTANLAGVFGVDRTNVTASEVTGRADQTLVTVRMHNPTEQVVRWPGLSAPGQSIADAPLRIGVREDGKPTIFYVTGDEEESRPAPHTMWSGMTGSGKSTGFIIAVLEMISRIDCAPVVADPEKFMLTFGSVMDVFQIAADGPEQTEQLISNLPETLRYRAALLGSLGYEQWVPECWTEHGIPVVPVHIEEAAGYLANNTDFNTAIRLARALGMPLSASMQVMVFRNLQRETRSQFGNSIAFGVKEMQDAKFALTDATLNAGADPTRWGANEPGRCYAEVIGVPSDEWALKNRVYKITAQERREAIDLAEESGGMAQIDQGTFDRLNKGMRRPVKITMMPQIPDLSSVATGPEDAPLVLPGEPQDAVPAFALIKGGAPEDKPSPEVAREMICDRIAELEARGVTSISIGDFADLMIVLERHRTWPYTVMNRLVKTGRLVREEGAARRYTIIPEVRSEDG
jgi:hypothetical protein